MADYLYLTERNKQLLLKKARTAHSKTILYQAPSEELLRFALEKTNVHIVTGMEKLHPKDHTHYVRSGLDQVLCKIATQHHKTIGFDFMDILNSADRGRLMARIRFNLKLCRKYKVQTKFFDSSNHISEPDLQTFLRVLEKEKKS